MREAPTRLTPRSLRSALTSRRSRPSLTTPSPSAPTPAARSVADLLAIAPLDESAIIYILYNVLHVRISFTPCFIDFSPAASNLRAGGLSPHCAVRRTPADSHLDRPWTTFTASREYTGT